MSSDDNPRRKFWQYAILAVPIAIVDWIVLVLHDKLFSQPWHGLFIVGPLAIVLLGIILWKERTGRTLLVGRSYLLILGLYVLIFSFCAGTNILNYQRTLVGYEETLPPNFLSLNRLGDWRYWFARRIPAEKDIAIVLMDPIADDQDPQGALAARRSDITRLIKLAAKEGAQGIAFDFYFNENSDSEVDQMMCSQITGSVSNGAPFPVLAGYNLRFANGVPYKGDIASNLQLCLTDARLGHLVGYSESDHRIRMLPLYLRKVEKLPSLSFKIAQFFQSDIAPTSDGLLQYVRPQSDITEIRYQDLFEPNDAKRNNERLKLRDNFLIVGEKSTQDTFHTPYGQVPGVAIHAWAVHSLRQKHYLQRTPWWSSFFLVLVTCYIVTLMFDRKISVARTLVVCILLTVTTCALSLITIRLWAKWIDIIYPILAIWLLFLFLWAPNKIRERYASIKRFLSENLTSRLFRSTRDAL